MNLTSKEKLLRELCRTAGVRDVGNLTRTEVAAKLAAIKANSRAAALEKIASAFHFEPHHVAACK